MIKKLKKNNGETLIEAMVSLLMAVLSIALVASAAIAASNINQNTRKADIEFAEQLEKAEIYSAANVESKKLRIKFDNGSFLVIDGNEYENVDVYGDGSIFASYK